jgi:5S rRNA maturation endonuclease (ribonuclease M5)
MTRPVEVVYAALEARDCRPRGNEHRGYTALCPVPSHEDRTPSLSLSEGHDGRALLKCFAGCEYAEIIAALGLEPGDTFADDAQEVRRDDWTVEAEYVYTDADGGKLFKVIRFAGKRFRQKRWSGSGWEWGLDGVDRVLYRLPDVLAAKARHDLIFLTEGEKDAEAVCRAGRCGTTMPGGAGSWSDDYTETLKGTKVIILADDDEPGRKHAEEVFRRLHGKAVVNVCLPAEGHKDIAAQLAAGGSLTRAELRRHPVMDDAPASNGNGHRPGAFTAAVFASRKTKVDEVLGPVFCRGMRTVIGAQTGEGKSTWAMQAVRCLVSGEPFLDERWAPRVPGRALIVDLEQGEATVQLRLQEAGLDTSEAVDILHEPNGILLDKREEDRAMVRDILRDGGYSMVVLDPLYQTHSGGGNDEEVAAAVANIIDGWAREFNMSLVIPMHARKPHPEAGKNFTKHDIAGVNTWLRNAEVVLGLQIWYTMESKLHFFKDRIGRGPQINTHWWLDFERDAGFKRNHREQTDRIERELKALLKRDEGATKEELLQVTPDETLIARLTKGKPRNGDRWRTKKWPGGDTADGQTQLGGDVT